MNDTWLALVLIGVQCGMIGALLLFVRRFGVYADVLQRTHEANQVLVAEIRRLRGEADPPQERSA